MPLLLRGLSLRSPKLEMLTFELGDQTSKSGLRLLNTAIVF